VIEEADAVSVGGHVGAVDGLLAGALEKLGEELLDDFHGLGLVWLKRLLPLMFEE
jgi:hypothetical protein